MSDDALGPGGIHASAVAFADRAVLIRGGSGSGKSTLALALLTRCLFDGTPGRLLADDRVRLRIEEQTLVAWAPQGLAGLIEVRGAGLLRVPVADPCPIRLVVDLAAAGETPERLPRRRIDSIAGITLPAVRWPARASATGADLVIALLSGAELVDPDAG
jgi:HPr kinase/phosphorylase